MTDIDLDALRERVFGKHDWPLADAQMSFAIPLDQMKALLDRLSLAEKRLEAADAVCWYVAGGLMRRNDDCSPIQDRHGDIARTLSIWRALRDGMSKEVKLESGYSRFELLAERFYRETGMIAPGKDAHPEDAGGTWDERADRWRAWLKENAP